MQRELRKFVAPEFVFGNGSRALAAQYAKSQGARRPLLVTDPGVMRAGWVDSVLAGFREEGMQVVVFDGVTSNPTDGQVQEGVREYRARGCDVVVAVGGGSPMDCAKGIAIVASNDGHIGDYEGINRIRRPCPPLVCVPTTAGTSVDVSQFAIIVSTAARYKMVIVSKAIVADVALVDPETTTTMGEELTALTGLEALCHAVEALMSNASSPITDMCALDAVPRVMAHLRGACEHPKDMVHREAMMLASLHAGLAFSNASLGVVHALAHALAGPLDLPHGECSSALLPHVIAYNSEAAKKPLARMAQAIGIKTDDGAWRQALMEAVFDLRRGVGVKRGLAAMGLKREAIPAVARTAMDDACIVTSPRRPTHADLEAILEQAL